MRPPTPRTGRTGSRNAARREPAEPSERRRRDGERAPRSRRAPEYCRQHTAFLKEHVALPATATPVADRNRGNPSDADGESRDRFQSRRDRRLINGDAGPDRSRDTQDRSEAKRVERTKGATSRSTPTIREPESARVPTERRRHSSQLERRRAARRGSLLKNSNARRQSQPDCSSRRTSAARASRTANPGPSRRDN